MKINEYLSVKEQDGQLATVCRCGYVIGPAGENYKTHLTPRVAPVRKAGPHVNPHAIGEGRFVLREFSCPACLTQLDVEVTLANEPPRWDVQIGLSNRSPTAGAV